MDPGGPAAGALTAAAGSLSRLAESTGSEFPHLGAARLRTERGLAEVERRLASVQRDPDTAVVLLGSWGRRERTAQSDDDFLVLADGDERGTVRPDPAELRAVLSATPGEQGTFGTVAYCDHLVTRIGLDKDDNRNVTQRMLLVLESVAVAGEEVHRHCWERVLDGYLVDLLRDRHPPRFFLNDLIRYWRTICVDFVGKERDEPEKWGLRTAKLRTARKLLFASGLLPGLFCGELTREEIRDFLIDQFSAPATDRVAWAFLHAGAPDVGLRTLRAYDRWLGMLDDRDTRAALAGLTRAEAERSPLFAEVRRIATEIEHGLLALLFDTQPLRALTREYAIF
jgi:hypothetical protein